MLFHYTEEETTEAKAYHVTVRKGPLYCIPLYAAVTALFITCGVLCAVFRPIPQYFTFSLCLFIAALIPVFYLVGFLAFRLRIGNGRIALRTLTKKETFYSYTDLSWKLLSPEKKHSKVLLFANGKQIASILRGAEHLDAVLALRHKGTLASGEKELLRTVSAQGKK